MRRLILAFAFLLVAGSARAASFDCAKAATAVEKRICAEPWLSRADEAMARAYAEALAASPTPLSVRAEQQSWLKNERAAAADLDALITGRGVALRARAAADRRARTPLPLAAVGRRCTPVFAQGRCTVKSSGRVAGEPDLMWQILQGDDEAAASVVLDAPQGAAEATPLVWTQDVGAFYDEPRVTASPDGPLLVLGGVMSGTGGFNVEAVFERTGRGRWAQIDSQAWLTQLAARLPKGLGVWKGVFPDYGTFTASTPLWKGDDANCCATGGMARVRLRLVSGRLVLADAKLTLGAKAARGD